MYDFLLLVHVLAASALFATVVMYTAFAIGGAASPRAVFVADRLWDVGGLGTLVFGIWLALNRAEYEIWDGWIIAALVLWFVSFGTQNRTRELLEQGSGSVALWNGIRAALVLALLLIMIFKPGA